MWDQVNSAVPKLRGFIRGSWLENNCYSLLKSIHSVDPMMRVTKWWLAVNISQFLSNSTGICSFVMVSGILNPYVRGTRVSIAHASWSQSWTCVWVWRWTPREYKAERGRTALLMDTVSSLRAEVCPLEV